ncbi:LysR family transcriptional regulator [Atlantibacter subterraneus]|uniref:LysR family transcriptional regulator n=1 Tax=Atlantibacter subterraneus TaxID=255519 RepID=UPI002964D23D|nr:LysR family transcriptional regulator [Atlantibacter subterranea]MDW2743468.1 LysR family transcriptional regulator [Atlantibacter subterranea]
MNDPGSITLRALKMFIDVYETQNFSVIARREGISASQVSRVIQQLEDALGQQLFYRNTRAIIPTESAHLFIEHARMMTGQIEEARIELLERTLEPSGLVRINAPVFFGQRHIAPWLAGLSERFPRLLIDLTQTDDYIDPHRDAADLLFRIGPLTDSSFQARVFGVQRYHLAASPAYLARYGTPHSPADIHQHQCLVYRGSSGPNRWLLKSSGGEWVHYAIAPLLTSNNAETLLIAALNGMGIVLFPDWLINDRLKTGELVRLLPESEASIRTEPLYIAAIYPHTRHQPLNVRVVIDYFVEVFGEPLYWQN